MLVRTLPVVVRRDVAIAKSSRWREDDVSLSVELFKELSVGHGTHVHRHKLTPVLRDKRLHLAMTSRHKVVDDDLDASR